MTTTMDLMDKALKRKRAAAWARDMNITPQALSVAKRVGRLSPVIAGNFAIGLGEDPAKWMALASLEAEKDGPLKDVLLKRLQEAVNKSSFIARFDVISQHWHTLAWSWLRGRGNTGNGGAGYAVAVG